MSTYASESLKIPENKIQQQLYIKAERFLVKPDSSSYKEVYEQLTEYPLQPYLDQRRLLKSLRLSSAQEIDVFLRKYQGTPLDWPLRKKWLNYLAKQNKPKQFIKFYKNTSNVKLHCQYLRFQLAEGLPESVVFPKVTQLWTVGKSQDKTCDPLFERWQKAGYRTNDVVWQRIALAADGGKHTLIPYLTKLLLKEQQYLGVLWHKVRRDPSIIQRKKYFPNKNIKETQILVYGLERLIWRYPNTAIKVYKKSQNTFHFSEQQQQKITEKFAIALAAKNHEQARTWFNKLNIATLNKTMLQWRLSQALKEQDWERLIVELKQLPPKYKNDLQWRYWYAKALIYTGEEQRGKYLLEQLASKRHYYGFLAASYLQTPVNMQNNPLSFSLVEKRKVMNHPAAKRAFEFYHLQRLTKARSEWNYLMKQLSHREKLIAAKVAYENQWFDRSIFTLANVGYLDDVTLRFPKAFDSKINLYATDQQIDPAWAFAIARRESSFMTDAHSSAGARGLMQIMPSTARHLKKAKISYRYLLDAENNIALGTQYLKVLLDKNKGNAVLATASYNAGPYRVKSWLKNTEAMPADIWIETIPFKETRNYVKSVLAYQAIYQHKTGKGSEIFDEVVSMTVGG